MKNRSLRRWCGVVTLFTAFTISGGSAEAQHYVHGTLNIHKTRKWETPPPPPPQKRTVYTQYIWDLYGHWTWDANGYVHAAFKVHAQKTETHNYPPGSNISQTITVTNTFIAHDHTDAEGFWHVTELNPAILTEDRTGFHLGWDTINVPVISTQDVYTRYKDGRAEHKQTLSSGSYYFNPNLYMGKSLFGTSFTKDEPGTDVTSTWSISR